MIGADYFQSHQDYFWIWEEEDGEDVIAIPHGMTIAYKNFIQQVVERVYGLGLPPFGSLLLVIIATNPGGGNALDAVYKILGTALKTTDDPILSKAISFLKLLTELPDQYKEGDLRIMLIQTLFNQCHYIHSVRSSKEIYTYFRNQGAANEQTTKKLEFNKSTFSTDFRTISLLSNKFFSVNDILSKIAYVPDLTQHKIELESPPSTVEEPVAVDFVDELMRNPKTFAVGSLIRRLWGGLNIPIHNTLPSQQPLGGIADLTNKGEYDKLLVSEFANDDLVFLSRLANNEALYIHREVPPSDNRMERIILIDSTLKNWGTSKTIAFALMLAVVKHPKTDIGCSVYVLGAERYYPVSVENINTIIEALQIVEGSLHAAKSLELFLKEHDERKNEEILFITEASTPKYPAVLKIMNEHPQAIHYLFLTDAAGNVDIYKRHKNSRKHIQHLLLNLEELWRNKNKTKDVKEETGEIQGGVDFPILVTNISNTKKLLTTSTKQLFKVSSDGIVLLLANPMEPKPKGWEVIYKGLPFTSEICEIGINEKGDLILLLFHVHLKEVALINLTSGYKNRFGFKQWSNATNKEFVFEAGYFWHFTASEAWRISTDGNITEHKIFESSKFQDRQNMLATIPKHHFHVGSGSVLKNVKKVFINEDRQLVLNAHALGFFSVGNTKALKFVQSRNKSIVKAAIQEGENIFRFDNGSIVEVDRAGIILLKSVQESIPTIFIPTKLDVAIGAATPREFAGNDYYYKESKQGIILYDAGPNKLQVVEYLKETLNLSLADAKYLPDNTPAWLRLSEIHKPSHTVKEELSNFNAVAIIKRADAPLAKIEISSFYNEYIATYINSIL